ncbi:hypothetical protein MRX96_025241 [Rhipicephalus microplus]
MKRLSAASTVALCTLRSAGALLQLLAHLPFSSCYVSGAAIEADCGPHKTQMTSEKAREKGVLFFRTSREDSKPHQDWKQRASGNIGVRGRQPVKIREQHNEQQSLLRKRDPRKLGTEKH